MKLILLNGPPRCGKDTAGAALQAALTNAEILRFSGPLKPATHVAFGLAADTDTESYKDDMREEFRGLTPRAAYIAMSEQGIKATFGRDHFGRVFTRALAASSADYVIATDSGFDYEAVPAVAQVTAANTLLVQIYRAGCDFSRDSRSYIQVAGVRTLIASNAADTPEAFAAYIVPLVKNALGLPV